MLPRLLHFTGERKTDRSKYGSELVQEELEWHSVANSSYPHLHQMLNGFVLGQDLSSIHDWWKYVQQFLCGPADQLDKQPTNGQEWAHNPPWQK